MKRNIKSEMTGFLATIAEQVASLTEADLQRYKASVLSGLEETPKNLGELNSRFMESLGLGYSALISVSSWQWRSQR